jgi:amidohydrolase
MLHARAARRSFPFLTLALLASAPLAAVAAATAATAASAASASALDAKIAARAAALEPQMLEWRRWLHQHPELGNREVETAKFVAEHLRAMGLEPRTGVAKTGVVAVITGGRPGPVVALRSDMDALPVKEEVDLPFASQATGTYEGKPVSVMHACGHDTHMAMLLGAAQILTEMKAQLPGKVVLLFQPAEEGVPNEEGMAGAELMVKEGVLDDPKVDVVFGIHSFSGISTGTIGYRSGPELAAADEFEIVIQGKQTHGSAPWKGVDPIVVGAQIVDAIQTLVSRQLDITKEPAVVTVGQFESGVRNNIIPDRARLVGTIRTFDEGMRDEAHARLKKLAEGIAAASGAVAMVTIHRGYPVTVNDPALTEKMLPTLQRVTGGKAKVIPKVTGAEDFSYYAQKVPGLFVILGVTPEEKLAGAASNHSPRFFVDESALTTGMKTLATLAADYLTAPAPKR